MKSSQNTISYTAVIQQDEKGHHLVSFPALPGCFTCGETFADAIKMGQEVLELWIEELAESGKEIPNEQLSSVTVLHAPRSVIRKRSKKSYATIKRQRA